MKDKANKNSATTIGKITFCRPLAFSRDVHDAVAVDCSFGYSAHCGDGVNRYVLLESDEGWICLRERTDGTHGFDLLPTAMTPILFERVAEFEREQSGRR